MGYCSALGYLPTRESVGELTQHPGTRADTEDWTQEAGALVVLSVLSSAPVYSRRAWSLS